MNKAVRVEILRKLERNNLCSLVTIPRHECGQHDTNGGQKPRVAPSRCLKALSGWGDCYRELPRILIPRTSVNKGKRKGWDIAPQPSTTPFLDPSYKPRAWATSEEKSVWWCAIFHPSASRR